MIVPHEHLEHSAWLYMLCRNFIVVGLVTLIDKSWKWIRASSSKLMHDSWSPHIWWKQYYGKWQRNEQSDHLFLNVKTEFCTPNACNSGLLLTMFRIQVSKVQSIAYMKPQCIGSLAIWWRHTNPENVPSSSWSKLSRLTTVLLHQWWLSATPSTVGHNERERP